MFDLVGLWVRLLAPDASPDAYNDWRFVSTSRLSETWLYFLAALVLLSSIGSALGLRRVTRRGRVAIGGLRAFAAMLVVFLLWMPAIELRAVSKVRSRIALLLDESRSMGLGTPEGPRIDRVLAHLAEHRQALEKLKKGAVLEVSTFADRLRPADAVPEQMAVEGDKTDLGRTLSELGGPSSGRDLGAVILYSDGTDTEGLTLERARQLAQDLEVPIYPIGFSTDQSAPDLAVRRIMADEFAFVHNTVTLDAEIEQRGLDVASVPVTLRREGKVVAQKEARFDLEGKARVTFEFKPNRIGKIAYEVAAPVQAGEVVASNNRRSIVLKVIRDRIRVLQVAGRPSWDERFLRELLKRNPNVDLISFFILRSTTDLQKAPQEELALIPFPVNELFTKELHTFDVVIYQNFSYRPYRMAGYLRNIQEYVLRGGSFLMIGGDTAFDDGWYGGTPIESILPLRLGGTQPYDGNEFRPRLTREGRLHPITRIGEPGEPPETAYARLPPLAGFNSSLGLAEDSQALLVHPSLPGNPPLLALREVGEGRTMALTTDSLWFWRFLAVGDGRAGREFDRFWNQALRWLIRDPELARVRLRGAHSVFALGEAVEAEVRVLGLDYHGEAGARVAARLIPVEGEDGSAKEQSVITGSEGSAALNFGETTPGTYTLRADAFSSEGDPIGTAEEPVIVEAADAERLAPFPRPDLLEAIAEGSGGRYTEISDGFPKIEIKETRRVEVDRTRRVPVWDSAVLFLLLLLVLGAEWWIRRRAGLL